MTAFGMQQMGQETMSSAQAAGMFLVKLYQGIFLCDIGRLGIPADIGGLTLFLCSPAGSFVTGQHIMLDGGTTIVFGKMTPENKL